MWVKLSGFLIRNRVVLLLIMLAITTFMGFEASKVELSYDFPQVVPQSDPDYVFYRDFKSKFGEDGNTVVFGFDGKDAFSLPILQAWYRLGKQMRTVKGVGDTVISIAEIPTAEKDAENKRFITKPLIGKEPTSQAEADSFRRKLLSMPFYKDVIYNEKTGATCMVLRVNRATLLSKDRLQLIFGTTALADSFAKATGVNIHYSGLPYIRTIFSRKIQKEINFFLGLSVALTSLILLIFFRSFYNVVFPLVIIGVIMTWTVGSMHLLGYKITLLSALIPPLIVIIGVPNFIYFVSRYHQEYKKNPNKIPAITSMVVNIAKVVFLNNTTTAIGFGVLFFIDSPVLREFGVIAFIMICGTYLATLVLTPIVYSFLPEPKQRHIYYLENPLMKRFLNSIEALALKRRKLVYTSAILIMIASVIGMSNLKSLGYILDDVPHTDKLYVDMSFFEKNFKGIMPLEIVIDTKKKNGLLNLAKLNKISQLEDTLRKIPGFGTTLSIVDVVKFARQSFYNGDSSMYGLPEGMEQAFLLPYLKGMNSKSGGIGHSMVNNDLSIARVSCKIKDVGSVRLETMLDTINTKTIPAIFTDSSMKVTVTGYSRLFLKGNEYLIENLIGSLVMAIALITIVIAFLFRSFRLVIITLIPNILALLITGGIMGFFSIHLKPSTVLVFSIAFGIAVDASFHFLVTYRQDLARNNWDVEKTISQALHQTGFSIVYTSLVLFFGFGIFCFSSFGSTVALGALTSITLLCAMFTNIILLPALLNSFDRRKPKNQSGKY